MPVISVVNMKGGVAKTTLATNLADALVRRYNKTVLLVDIDPQFNATQCLISPEVYVQARAAGKQTIVDIFDDAPPHVSAVAKGAPPIPSSLKDIVPWKIKNRFDLVPGDLELYRLDLGGGQGRELRLKRYLEAIDAETLYDFVIIDTPPTPSHWMTAALLASDSYIIPVRPDPLSRTGVDLLRSVVERFSSNFGHAIECIGVVLTMTESGTVVYKEALDFLDKNPLWKGKRFTSTLPKRVALARAQGRQKLILDLDDHALKSGIAGIAREFLEQFDG